MVNKFVRTKASTTAHVSPSRVVNGTRAGAGLQLEGIFAKGKKVLIAIVPHKKILNITQTNYIRL